MVTTKMWKSIRNLFHFLPIGMLVHSPNSKSSLQKHSSFRRNSVIYFIFYSSHVICLPFHIIYRICVLPLTLPLKAIHYLALVLAICAVTLAAVFAYAMFGPGEHIILLYNSISSYQKKTFGMDFYISTKCKSISFLSNFKSILNNFTVLQIPFEN